MKEIFDQESNKMYNETEPIKQSSNYKIMSNNNEDNHFNNNNKSGIHSTYMKFAIKYKLPANFQSILSVSHLGSSIGLCPDINGDPLIILGPQWPLFLGLFILLSFSYFFIHYYLDYHSFQILLKFGWPLYIIWSITYLITSLKNPGYPKTNLESVRGSKEMSYCDKCEIWYKPESQTIHCDKCDICIEGYIHHCSCTGHCIGTRNKNMFYLFVVFSTIFLSYLLICFALNKIKM